MENLTKGTYLRANVAGNSGSGKDGHEGGDLEELHVEWMWKSLDMPRLALAGRRGGSMAALYALCRTRRWLAIFYIVCCAVLHSLVSARRRVRHPPSRG